jgi:hypothetical protein
MVYDLASVTKSVPVAFYRIEGDGVRAIACVRAEESLYSVD